MNIDDPRLPERDERAGLADLTREDADRYLAMIEDIDLSEEQKTEFLLIVWDIMRMWVEFGFTGDPCGHLMSQFTNAVADEAPCTKEQPETKACSEGEDAYENR
jgi:hypothetical protein